MNNHTDPVLYKPEDSTVALFLTLLVLVILIRCVGAPGCNCKRKPVSVYDGDDISIVSEDNEDSSLLDSETCSICLSKINKKYYITECGHLYHQKCLNRWHQIQKDNLECPVCREVITKLEPIN